MNSEHDDYFLSAAYQARPKAKSFDVDEAPTYWAPKRVNVSRRRQSQYNVYVEARRLMKIHNLKTVLDVGSGPGLKAYNNLSQHASRTVLIDQPNVASDVATQAPGCEFRAVNLEQPEVDLSGPFDLIVFADVIEHLLDPNPCVDMILGQLAPNGLAVISTPERDIVRGVDCIAPGNLEHIREWNRDEFSQYLTSRGFEVLAHLLVPQRRIPWPEWLLSRILRWSGLNRRSRRWYGCQLAVCRRGENNGQDTGS